ncbi:JmjC domain-containing protein [Micromonospora sp. NPDC002575]|uniref:JmjC domain-containing protein n=1 Tax=Micromonospora sp. NPDC002575 TaxID=3364222 RepID=UPI0036863F63
MSGGLSLLTTESSRIEAAWGRRTAPMSISPPLLAVLDQIAVERLLEERILRPPYVSFARGGRQIPDHEVTVGQTGGDTGFLDRAKARSLVASGATVMLYQAHHWIDSLATIATHISSALRATCSSTVFHTPANSPGLTWHRDGQHVIAVQIAGSKNWHVERTVPAHWWSTGFLPTGGPDADVTPVTLRRGQALYLPPGVAHTAQATGETSTHVSFVIQEPETKDLALAMFERALLRVKTRLEEGPLHERGARAAAVARELASAMDELDIDGLLEMVEEDSMQEGRSPTHDRRDVR